MYDTKDDQSLENLINEHLYILEIYSEKKVNSLRNLGRTNITKNEIVSIAYEGLYKAVINFDESVNNNFFGYAWQYIDFAFKTYQRKIDPLHQDTREKVKKIQKANESLIQSLGRTPTEQEIAKKTNLDVKQIKKINRLGLDSIQYDELSTGSLEIENGEQPADMKLEEQERTTTLGKDMNDCLETALAEDQKRIIELMYLDSKSAETIALSLWNQFGSKEKNFIYNTVKSGKNKLKQCMQQKGWSVTDL